MSSDGGSARNTLASQCSTSSSGSTDSARRRREYWKKDRKIVRILTVLAYIVSVSTAAVLLSAYYVFLWNPQPKHHSRDIPRPLSLALGPSQESLGEIERPIGRSFAMSASQVDLRVPKNNINNNAIDVKTNTKVYQQRQIPTPQSTVTVPTTEMPNRASRPILIPILRKESPTTSVIGYEDIDYLDVRPFPAKDVPNQNFIPTTNPP